VHRFKDPKSKRLKTLLGLTGRAKHKIIMTGTPILNSYLDLWAQFMILDGGKTFGNNFFVFRAKYFRDKNAGWASKPGYFPDWVPKPGIEAEISRLIDAKSSRRHEDDVLKLPPRIFKKAYVEMGKEQAKVYRQMEEQLVAEIEAGTCAATNALSQVTRLLQILAGYLPLPEMQSTGFFDDNPRLERLHELLRELSPQNKIIVWACFTPEYQLIESKLKYLGIEFAELTGRIQEKQAEIERFRNDPKCRVMIANAKAGGVGVNLVEAAYSIYYSRGYSLGDYEQSAARNRRGGSEIHSSVVQIDLVVKNTLDEEVLDALQRKENFASTVLDRLKRK
jgi:SNF2 family DNA or RNA helicase